MATKFGYFGREKERETQSEERVFRLLTYVSDFFGGNLSRAYASFYFVYLFIYAMFFPQKNKKIFMWCGLTLDTVLWMFLTLLFLFEKKKWKVQNPTIISVLDLEWPEN